MKVRKTYLILSCLLVLLLGGILVVEGCGSGKSTDELIADLKSEQEKDRMAAVRTLPVNSDEAEKVIPKLIEALKDTQGDIRLSAAIKLGVYGELAREAIPALRLALQDHDARVRNAASKALSKIEHYESTDKSSNP